MYEILRQAYPPRQVPVPVSGVDGDVGVDRERVEGVRTEERTSCGSFDFDIESFIFRSNIQFRVPYELVEIDPILFEVRPDSLLTEIIEENNIQPEEAKEVKKERQLRWEAPVTDPEGRVFFLGFLEDNENLEIKKSKGGGKKKYYDYETTCPVKYFDSSKAAFLFSFKDACLKGKVWEKVGDEYGFYKPDVVGYRSMYLRIAS